MPQYNMSNIVQANQTGILELIQGINSELMFGMLGNIFLIGLSTVIFTSLYVSTGDFNKAWLSTSFIAFVISLNMVALSLCNPITVFITLMSTIAAVAFSYKASD